MVVTLVVYPCCGYTLGMGVVYACGERTTWTFVVDTIFWLPSILIYIEYLNGATDFAMKVTYRRRKTIHVDL